MAPDDAAGKEIARLPTESTTVSIEEFTLSKTSMETRMETLNVLLTKLLEAEGTSFPEATLPLANPQGLANEELKANTGDDTTKTEVPQLNQLMGQVLMLGFPSLI